MSAIYFFSNFAIKLSLSHALSREKKTKRRATTDLLRSFALCLRLIVPLLYVGREARAKRKGIKKFSSSWEDEEEETITNRHRLPILKSLVFRSERFGKEEKHVYKLQRERIEQ